MGVTINYKLAQETGRLKVTLDKAEKMAKFIKENQAKPLGVSFSIRRGKNFLMVDIGGCETLAFEFNPLSYWKNKAEPKPYGEGWSYQWASLEELKSLDTTDEHYERYPDQKLLWCAYFCKTQFSKNIFEHKWVADITKCVACYCNIAVVNDEGDYYHTGEIGDAAESIYENGKLIDSIGGMLTAQGFNDKQIVKGETIIKPLSKKPWIVTSTI